jgi:anti-anti-sigma factor
MNVDTRRFSAEVEAVPDAVRLRLRGDIDLAADAALSGAYARVAELGARQVTLDFGDVGYVNSTGIALIVRLLAEARRDGREVHAHGLTPHYREIFRITRLSDYVVLDDEEEERNR